VWVQVAAHFESAGMPVPALAAYRRAGEAAERVHANAEAVRLFRRAMALLPALPSSGEQAAEELELCTALGACLVASQGYPDAEVKGIYERAIALCQELGRPPEAPALRALAIGSLTSGDLRQSEALGQELLAVHARERDPIVYVEGHYVLGVSYFWRGRFADARTQLEQSIAGYDPRGRETHFSLYAQDPKAVCLCRLAWTLWYLGYPGQSRAKLDEALALVRELRHPHTESYVLYFGAMLCIDAREPARASELLEALAQHTARHSHFFWEFRGHILQCFLRAEEGDTKEPLERAGEHMAMYDRVGNRVMFSAFHGLRAGIHLRHGALREGLAAIDEAFASLETIDERYCVPELHRLRGELLAAQGANPAEAETCFRRALQLAREQQAKSSELRAAMSLGRLWCQQRRKKAARELVAGVFAWFTEGFDTADVRDARARLDQWK
jgi:tetratricopeptide (TPR) repeat protein